MNGTAAGAPLTLVNARVVLPGGELASSITIAEGRIARLGTAPSTPHPRVDLEGAFVLPGLVNAHDHLELNHYGRVTFRDRYAHVSEWVEDMQPRLRSDPGLLRGRAYPLEDRLLIGGLKNLLAGATTVAHHNPFYDALDGPFPVRVVRRYGWAHSLYLQEGRAGAHGESGGDVGERHRATPGDWPFFVHLAEGTDGAARGELAELERLGALHANTVLVHGVGLTEDGWRHVAERGAGLVWCPASNLLLLGRTIPARAFFERHPDRLALGTDSRLTGARDLLEELRVAREASGLAPEALFTMVTRSAARLLRLPGVGALAPGSPADLCVVPPVGDGPFESLVRTARSALRLVMVGGEPRYGDETLRTAFDACGVEAAGVSVDGERKLLAAGWAHRLRASSVSEPGVVPSA